MGKEKIGAEWHPIQLFVQHSFQFAHFHLYCWILPQGFNLLCQFLHKWWLLGSVSNFCQLLPNCLKSTHCDNSWVLSSTGEDTDEKLSHFWAFAILFTAASKSKGRRQFCEPYSLAVVCTFLAHFQKILANHPTISENLKSSKLEEKKTFSIWSFLEW